MMGRKSLRAEHHSENISQAAAATAMQRTCAIAASSVQYLGMLINLYETVRKAGA